MVVNYILVDSRDNAVATATAILHLHDYYEAGADFENKPNFEYERARLLNEWVENNSNAAKDFDFKVKSTYERDMVGKVSGEFGLEFPPLAAKVIKLGTAKVEASGSVEWKESDGTSLEFAIPCTIRAGYRRYPMTRYLCHYRSFYVDKYQPDGYRGNELVETWDYNNGGRPNKADTWSEEEAMPISPTPTPPAIS